MRRILVWMNGAGLIFDSEFVEEDFEIVLCGQTGIHQETFDVGTVAKPIIIKHFQFIAYNERYIAEAQTLTEHNQAPYAPVAVLKWMDCLKPMVKI